jgi:hypothetical protein
LRLTLARLARHAEHPFAIGLTRGDGFEHARVERIAPKNLRGRWYRTRHLKEGEAPSRRKAG